MTDQVSLFGQDLKLADLATGLDLKADGVGDLALAAGADNLVQALTVRLRTRRGELARLGWPDYGSRLHELIGEPIVQRTLVKLMAFARQAVEQDPRVAEVSSVTTQLIPGERATVRVILEVVVISQPTPLNLVHVVRLEQP